MPWSVTGPWLARAPLDHPRLVPFPSSRVQFSGVKEPPMFPTVRSALFAEQQGLLSSRTQPAQQGGRRQPVLVSARVPPMKRVNRFFRATPGAGATQMIA